MDELKYCKKCDKYYPRNTDNFYKQKQTKDGLTPYCKECWKKKSKEYVENNKGWYQDYQKKWREENKEYKNNLDKEWFQQNKDYRREYMNEWQNENTDKLTQYRIDREFHKKHDITDEEWDECKAFFDYSCAYCGIPMENHFVMYRGKMILGDFHKEHFDHTGANDITNCIPSCKGCNSKKHDKTFEEWYIKDNEVFSEERLHKICKWIFEEVYQC